MTTATVPLATEPKQNKAALAQAVVVVGTVLAQTSVGITGAMAMIQVPLIHSVACLSMAIILIVLLAARRKQNRMALAFREKPQPLSWTEARNRAPYVASGSVAWIVVGCCTVLVPTYMAEIGLNLARDFGAIVLLA